MRDRAIQRILVCAENDRHVNDAPSAFQLGNLFRVGYLNGPGDVRQETLGHGHAVAFRKHANTVCFRPLLVVFRQIANPQQILADLLQILIAGAIHQKDNLGV
ncbi:hypothetical protein HRbin36_02490 [bacterium HR36]|nr:hypothetical protein HRbin36_02490 [bacterium HR36]